MMTRGLRIRRHLRSARVSALTEEERRIEIREAEARIARDAGTSGVAGDRAAAVARGSAGDCADTSGADVGVTDTGTDDADAHPHMAGSPLG
jgi:hypothetical protein